MRAPRCCWLSGLVGKQSSVPARLRLVELYNWPHLDRAAARLWHLCGHLDGFVQVSGIDGEDPDELLLRLGIGAVADGHFAVLNPYDGGGATALETRHSK